MTNASEIGHYSYLIHCDIDAFMDRAQHSLARLEQCAERGGYITPGALEAIQLHANALILKDMADAIMKRRAALLANQPQPFKQAAE